VVIGGGPATGGVEVYVGGTIIGAGAIGGNLVDNGVVIAGVAGQTLMINAGVTGTGTLMIQPGATLAAVVGTGSTDIAFTGTGEVLSLPTPGSLTVRSPASVLAIPSTCQMCCSRRRRH
jgi:hypothetical protein